MTRAGRVVLLLGPSTGGIRRHVAELAARLSERGWDVVTAGPAGVLDGLVPQDHVVDVPASSLAVGRAVRARAGLGRVLAGAGADLVHAHGLKAALVAATVRSRPPLVVTVHNLVLDEAAGPAAPVLRALEGALPRLADRVLAVSEGVAARFGGPPRVEVVSAFAGSPRPACPPAEVRRRLGVPDDAPLVVAVARLHPQKGLSTLLEALALVRRRVPTVHAASVGEGPLEAELRARARELGLDRVVFTGARANPADELAAADVVAIPSMWESGPLVLLEALQLGRPVVATPVGFVADYVVDGETGRLVPVGSPGRLADALVEVLEEPERSRALGQAGLRRVHERLAVDREVDRVVDAYQAVLRRSS